MFSYPMMRSNVLYVMLQRQLARGELEEKI